MYLKEAVRDQKLNRCEDQIEGFAREKDECVAVVFVPQILFECHQQSFQLFILVGDDLFRPPLGQIFHQT